MSGLWQGARRHPALALPAGIRDAARAGRGRAAQPANPRPTVAVGLPPGTSAQPAAARRSEPVRRLGRLTPAAPWRPPTSARRRHVARHPAGHQSARLARALDSLRPSLAGGPRRSRSAGAAAPPPGADIAARADRYTSRPPAKLFEIHRASLAPQKMPLP